MERGQQHAILIGLDDHRPLAPPQHDARQARHLLLRQRFADDRECLGRYLVGRRDVVGGVEVDRLDIVLADEGLEIERVRGFDLYALDLFLFDQ